MTQPFKSTWTHGLRCYKIWCNTKKYDILIADLGAMKGMDTVKKYQMKLFSHYFEELIKGNKHIEIRCNDSKRKQIKVGDLIEFIDINSDNRVTCIVRDIELYRSFKELLQAHSLNEFGFGDIDQSDAIRELRLLYSSEKESLGVLGIVISLTENKGK